MRRRQHRAGARIDDRFGLLLLLLRRRRWLRLKGGRASDDGPGRSIIALLLLLLLQRRVGGRRSGGECDGRAQGDGTGGGRNVLLRRVMRERRMMYRDAGRRQFRRPAVRVIRRRRELLSADGRSNGMRTTDGGATVRGKYAAAATSSLEVGVGGVVVAGNTAVSIVLRVD